MMDMFGFLLFAVTIKRSECGRITPAEYAGSSRNILLVL